MTAVLVDAIECFEKYHWATDRCGQEIFNETKEWLLANEADWLYSFERICEVLDLDSSAVRRQVLRSIAPRSQRCAE